MTEPNWDKYEHFSRSEFVCHCGCGRADMDEGYMQMLSALRDAYKKPTVVSSGFRCPEHNKKVSTTGEDGPHTTGKAADVLINGAEAFSLMKLSFLWGFSGVGLKQHGDFAKRFIHLDTLTGDTRPRVWTYT